MKSKTIIISSQDENEKGRGILTIFMEDGLLKCKLRLYNTPKLNRFCKLGIYHQNSVFSANLLEKNGGYSSSFVGDFDIEKDFYSAIIDTSNNNNVILSGGTYSGYFSQNNSIFDNVEKENPNTNLFNYDDPFYDEEIENNIEAKTQNNLEKEKICEESCDKCSKCKYKEYFYSHQEQNTIANYENTQDNEYELLKSVETSEILSNNENSELVESKNEEIKNEKSIINSLIPQFEYVFQNYKEDEILNNLIPNGKFVHIDENNESYSIGAIYEEDQMKYICYAVFRDYNSPVPQELGEHYQWLPIDNEDPLSEGYYIVFQDANDLKIVEM